MNRRVIGLLGAAVLFVVLFYASRFWVFAFWDRPGLFGWDALPPGGNLVDGWLRGTLLSPYDLLIWAIGAFAFLTLVQRFADRFGGKED